VIAERISLEPGIQVVNDVVFNQLVCRFGFELSSRNTDELTVRVIHRLKREGIIFATGAKWRGREVLRISVCNYQTGPKEAELAAQTIVAAFRREYEAG